jgi:hypothetical protein
MKNAHCIRNVQWPIERDVRDILRSGNCDPPKPPCMFVVLVGADPVSN